MREFLTAHILAHCKRSGKNCNYPSSLIVELVAGLAQRFCWKSGKSIKAVADILGDDAATILEHYGAVVPDTLDPSATVV